MLGWFARKCPVDEPTREWVDDRFSWLLTRLDQRVLDAPNTTPESLQLGDYRGTEEDAIALFERICDILRIDPRAVPLTFYRDEHRPGMTGTLARHRLAWMGQYQTGEHTGEICVDASLLRLPHSLVATFAHELAHEILLGGRLLDTDCIDHEMMTDLTTVVCGLGLFGASESLSDHFRVNQRGDSLGAVGYLPTPAWCWALSLRAWIRGDDGSDCLTWTRSRVRRTIQRGLRFLAAGGERYVPPREFLAEPRRNDLCRRFAPEAADRAAAVAAEMAVQRAVAADPAAEETLSAADVPDMDESDHSDDGGASIETTVLLLDAHELAQQGEHEAAIELLDQVVAMEADNEVAFQQRALSRIEIGLYKLAIEDGIRAVALEPDDVQSRFARGAAFVRGGRHDEGKADLQACIRATAGRTANAMMFRSRAWWLHGLAERDQRDFAAARESFRQAIRLWRDWPEPHEAMAEVCDSLAEFSQADAARAEAERRRS